MSDKTKSITIHLGEHSLSEWDGIMTPLDANVDADGVIIRFNPEDIEVEEIYEVDSNSAIYDAINYYIFRNQDDIDNNRIEHSDIGLIRQNIRVLQSVLDRYTDDYGFELSLD